MAQPLPKVKVTPHRVHCMKTATPRAEFRKNFLLYYIVINQAVAKGVLFFIK